MCDKLFRKFLDSFTIKTSMWPTYLPSRFSPRHPGVLVLPLENLLESCGAHRAPAEHQPATSRIHGLSKFILEASSKPQIPILKPAAPNNSC